MRSPGLALPPTPSTTTNNKPNTETNPDITVTLTATTNHTYHMTHVHIYSKQPATVDACIFMHTHGNTEKQEVKVI